MQMQTMEVIKETSSMCLYSMHICASFQYIISLIVDPDNFTQRIAFLTLGCVHTSICE